MNPKRSLVGACPAHDFRWRPNNKLTDERGPVKANDWHHCSVLCRQRGYCQLWNFEKEDKLCTFILEGTPDSQSGFVRGYRNCGDDGTGMIFFVDK